MGINKKGKRRIIVSNRTYYWYIMEEPYYLFTSNSNPFSHTVYIVSEDRKFSVHYILDSDFIAVTGKDFQEKPKDISTWRLHCPVFSKEICTPKVVSEIINWCLAEKNELVPVNWMGMRII